MKITIISAIKSVIWAMIGIQKKENLVKDFNHTEDNGPWLFIIIGIIMTILFVLSIVTVVQLVLP